MRPPSTVGMIKGIIASRPKLGKAYHTSPALYVRQPPLPKKKLKIRPSINLSIQADNTYPSARDRIKGREDARTICLSMIPIVKST